MNQFAGVLVHFSKTNLKSGAIGSVLGELPNVRENWFIFQELNRCSKTLAHFLKNWFIFTNMNQFSGTLAHFAENEPIQRISG
jgi:hypothetical protein